MLAYWIGYGLDLAVGDPVSVPHPIRYIGRLVRFWELRLLREGDSPGSLKPVSYTHLTLPTNREV